MTRDMARPATDHRRATAERNVAAILDAAERLLSRHGQLSIAAVAAEAGVSRVTVYAHFDGLPALVGTVVERAVGHADAALTAAAPGEGPPGEALERLLRAAWRELDRQGAIAQAAAQHVPPERLRSGHRRLIEVLEALVERGRGAGEFRTDLPAEWLVTVFYALLHAAGDDVRAGRADAGAAAEMLVTTIRDVFVGPRR